MAKPGRGSELQQLLIDGLQFVNEEPNTLNWYAFKISEDTFGIFVGAVVVIAAVMLTAWIKPLKEIIAPEKTVSKSICFAVYKADTYTSSIYNDASARLQVTVVKVRGNERSVVWQKNYDAKLLKQYPSAANAISQNVVIHNIAESKEHLEVLYTLTYDSKGSVMQLQDGKVISKGTKNGSLFINI